MRIVSGKYRRRKLFANPGQTTRPMTDRAKEMLFENLGGELAGERVADIFSGTGTLGLEALSRGAATAVFIEKDHKAYELLQQNVEVLQAEEVAFCWRTDVLRCSFKPKGKAHFWPYDLIFFDPPYSMVHQPQTKLLLQKGLERLSKQGVSTSQAQLIVRIPRHAEFDCGPAWQLKHQFVISGMNILWYSKIAEHSKSSLPSDEHNSD